MIPCFSAKMCITVTLYHVVPRHPILQKDTLFNTSKSEPGQLYKKNTAIHLRTIKQFLKLVYLRKQQPIYYLIWIYVKMSMIAFSVYWISTL